MYLFKLISALTNASKFLPFVEGTEVRFTNGEVHFIKIKQTDALDVGPGLRFSKYSYRTEIQSGDIVEVGYGESNIKTLAYEKSIAEALERTVFRILKLKGLGTQTTSGWTAHLSIKAARHSAFDELAERDAVLTHWLTKTPMLEVDPQTFPQFLKDWIRDELTLSPKFKTLRLLLTLDGFRPTVTSILQTETQNGVMSHATAPTLTEAYQKAMAETCRLASNTSVLHFFESSKKLATGDLNRIHAEDHAMMYAYHEKLPCWIFGKTLFWNEAKKRWTRAMANEEPEFEFHEIVKEPFSIGYATSPMTQSLYFGTTENAVQRGEINFKRLNLIDGVQNLNLMPHFIS